MIWSPDITIKKLEVYNRSAVLLMIQTLTYTRNKVELFKTPIIDEIFR